MKTLKKMLCTILVVLMLVTSAPLQGFVGLDINLPDFFSSEAKAAGVPGYSAGAAVKWALDHYNDIDSILTGKGYWSEGGDCANFVSQCVYMGGINMKTKWYSNGYWRVWDPFTWIRAHELYEYMVELGGVSINNPKASDLSVGDLIFYKTRSDGKMHHSAIVVDIQNGVPIICAHSVYSNGEYIKYIDSNWTLGYSGSRIYAVKMYGDMCEADNPRNFTVYTAKSGARKNLYSSPSTSSPVIGSTMAESYTYIHVYEERTVNGVRWGKMQWAGNWAWTKLSGFNRIRDISSYVPTHDFGAWKTIAIANCVNDGITERICKRCGYTQRNTTPKKGHVPGASATCLTPQVCTVCDTVLVDALGHDFEGGLKMPTCTEAASGSYTCTRCDFSYDITEKWTEYTVPLQEYNGHYYQLFNDAMTWQEAKELCEGLRGHLIVINDEAEQNFMTEIVADASKDNLWIGLYSDDDTLSWKWVNGEEVGYTNWGGLEPTEDITELYVHTYARDYNANKPAGVWNNMQNNGIGSDGGDYYTTSNYGFICEWDSYEDYPDIWKEETSASVKSETGYTYKEKEIVTSYETTLDGYTQDGGTWVKQSNGSIDYVAEWPPNTCTTEGFNTNNYYFSQYNKTPKYPSQTETTKVDVSTSTVGYLYWHWCYRHDLGRIENCRISDGYDYPIGNYRTDTFHAFFSSTPITYRSDKTSFELADVNKCPYTYWWIGKNIGTSNQLPVLRCNWTSYNRLFNYYKWSDNLGYTDKANLPDAVVSMIDNGTANSNYELGDSKTLYSYRLDALGHQLSEWYTVTVATCLENGVERRDCQRCDYYETEETTATCIEVKDEAVAPTCKDTGLTEGSHCGVCGKTITEQQIVPTTEHPFGEWKEVYPISCGKDGLEERVCSFCGFTDQRAIVNPNPDHLGPVTEKVITPGCEHLHAQGWTEYHCEKCDEQWTDNFTDPLIAVWGEWTVTIEPNCSLNPSKDPAENGERERVCQLCGMIDKETLIAEHNLVVYDVSSSCTTGGEKGEKCTVCNQIWTDGLDPLGHLLYDDWYTVYEAKCEEPGLERRDCNRNGCEYFETRIIDVLEHDYALIESVDATCESQGYDTYVCGNDSAHTYKDYNKPELGHRVDNNWITVKEPTCAEKGEEQCKCIRHDNGITCSKIYSREIEVDPDAHKWDDGVINPESTCKEHGTKTFTCQNDNSHKKTESVALNPNNHQGNTYIKDAKTETCTADGYTGDKYCSDCDALLEKGEAIAKLGHDMGEWSDNNNGTHTRECQRDNGCTYTETENCTFGNWVVTKEATCTAKGSREKVCTVCGYKVTEEMEMKVHTSGEIVIENKVAPKCEEKGSYDEVVYCTECSKQLSREKKEIPATGHDWDKGVINPESTCKLHGTKTFTCQNDNSHKKTESVTLNPNNHIGETYIKDAKTETCTADGCTGDKYCSDCNVLLEKGKSIDKLGHDWGEWKVSKDATIDSKGEEKRVCKRDSSHIETRETEKLIAYTAYFIKVNENGTFEYNGKKYDLVDTVRFAEGTNAIVNPDVPEEEGFIGYWEKYTLSNEDIYIEAVYELKSNDNQSDLISEKDVVYKDGVATITLSAFAETLNAKVPMGATPCDIILVLDQSSSMTSYKIGKETRLAVLKRVAKNFVDTVYESAEENEVDHRIALVSFSGTAENYKGTGLIGTNGSIKTFNKLTDADYASAFVAVNGNFSALKNGIDSLTGIRGTSSDYGLQMARQILANNQDGREKLVLFITDGEPGDPGRNMGAFNSTVANDAIEYANQIKNIYGTTIYSIGVAAGADPSDESDKINKFLHYVSSNYPNAKSMDNKGSAATMKNYFLSAEYADEIEKMFESIVSRQIVNTISFTKVNFYDTISEYFTLTTENENALREAVKAEYGVSDSDIIITRNADGTTTVRINNLVPKAVFNEKNVHIGYGATVKFDVTANVKTLEGGTFVTNTEDAGIENGGKTVIEFKVPEGKEISSGRAIVEFRIGDEVYAIREVSIGDKVIVPETDVADWVVTDGTTIRSDYTVFNTEYTSETRTVKWIIDGVTKEETYHIGEIIFAPQINNPDGKLFKGWNAKVPYRMPDYDLEFTAIFETHEHNYKQTAINGECTTGVTYTYTCDCEDSYTKTETYDAHKFTANVQLVNNESVATMTCTVCGKADSKVINYKAQYETNSWWNKTTKVVDLTLYDNAGISIQPDGFVYVKLYEEGDVLSNAKSGKLIVKRVNEDGSEDNIPYLKNSSVDKNGYYVEGNYIVLKLDHFSYYALIMPEDATNVPTYGEIECAFNGHHSYTSKVTAPTCKSEGYTTYTCSVCGDSYTGDKTDKAAHKYNKNVTSANCTDKGYTTYVCNVCGHSYKDNYTPALGHSMGAYVVTKQSTCTDKGTETATCSRCTHSETKSVAEKGHNYKNNVCTNCGKSKVENCNHLCHKKGFMGFIWKIVRFFWKLFKMNPVCDCGAKHY